MECLLAVKEAFDSAPGRAGLACGFKNTGIGMGHPDTGRCDLLIRGDSVELRTGAACVGQGLATILTQIACEVLGLEAERVEVALPDTSSTPDSGTSTASRQTLITGEACRRACVSARTALAGTQGGSQERGFAFASLAGRIFHGEFEAETDPFDSHKANPIRHVAYSYACHLAILGEDRRLSRLVAAHDSGLVVNPLAFQGQVEGGVAMGLGYALTEELTLADCAPTAKFGQLGLLRATDMPPIETIIVRSPGAGTAMDGGTAAVGFGAKGIGEISAIPTAAAVAGAYAAVDGIYRKSLPLAGTPYRKG